MYVGNSSATPATTTRPATGATHVTLQRGRARLAISASAAGRSTTTAPLTHARCAESARCSACGKHTETEQRAREQHPGAQPARVAADAPDAEGRQRDREHSEQDEPREQLLRGREAGERPRPIDCDDHARHADEVIRVGWHREVTRRPQVDHRVDDHPAPHDAGPRRRQLHDVRREADARAEHRPLHDGSGEAPERGAAAERQRETEVDAEQHRDPREHTADERPPAGAGIGGVGAEEWRACSSAANEHSASAAPPVHGMAMSCSDGITNITLSSTAATATHRPHQRTSIPAPNAMPTSWTSPASRSTRRCVPKTL